MLGYCDVTEDFSGGLAKNICRVDFFAHLSSRDLSQHVTPAAKELTFRGQQVSMQHYLMNPLFHPVTNAENTYNKNQIKTRVRIEQAFGLLKQRFCCLLIPLRIRLNNFW